MHIGSPPVSARFRRRPHEERNGEEREGMEGGGIGGQWMAVKDGGS